MHPMHRAAHVPAHVCNGGRTLHPTMGQALAGGRTPDDRHRVRMGVTRWCQTLPCFEVDGLGLAGNRRLVHKRAQVAAK